MKKQQPQQQKRKRNRNGIRTERCTREPRRVDVSLPRFARGFSRRVSFLVFLGCVFVVLVVGGGGRLNESPKDKRDVERVLDLRLLSVWPSKNTAAAAAAVTVTEEKSESDENVLAQKEREREMEEETKEETQR